MSFRVSGLDPARFQPLWSMTDAELTGIGAQRVRISERFAAPCRISLDDAEPGEDVVLLSFEHQPGATPYRQQGPIFVRQAAQRFDEVDQIPPAFARRVLSLRAFDRGHAMVDADLTEGAQARGLIERMLGQPEIAYIHAHYARRGCFAGLIERA